MPGVQAFLARELDGWKPEGGRLSFYDGMVAKFRELGIDIVSLGDRMLEWMAAKARGKASARELNEGYGRFLDVLVAAKFPDAAKAEDFSFARFFFASQDGVMSGKSKETLAMFDLFFTQLTTDKGVYGTMRELFEKHNPKSAAIESDTRSAFCVVAIGLVYIAERLNLRQEDFRFSKTKEGVVQVMVNTVEGSMLLFNDLFSEVKTGSVSAIKEAKQSGAQTRREKAVEAKIQQEGVFANFVALAKTGDLEKKFAETFGPEINETFVAFAQRLLDSLTGSAARPVPELKVPEFFTSAGKSSIRDLNERKAVADKKDRDEKTSEFLADVGRKKNLSEWGGKNA